MASRKRQSDLATTDWEWDSDADGRWPYETIRTACIAETARQSIIVAGLLRSILNRLDALGVDGLHYLLRDETARRRKAERQRRMKNRLARLRRKAARDAK